MANYSLGEIDALARKATRGAGYSWGIAEEAGKSVRWLSAYGFSGAEILAKHLEGVDDNHQSFIPKLISASSKESMVSFGNDNAQICALYCGTLINDLGHYLEADKTLSFSNMLSPLLALSSAARITELSDMSVSFVINELIIDCNSTGISIKGTPPPLCTISCDDSVDVSCNRTQAAHISTHFPSPASRPIEQEVLTILERFAHKTYAPATEESRLRGAG